MNVGSREDGYTFAQATGRACAHAAKTTLLPRKRCGGTSPRCIGRVPRGLRADETVRPIAAREPCSAARSRRSFTKRSALLSRDAFRVLFPSLPSGILARSMRRFCPQFRASFGTQYSLGQNSLSSTAKRCRTARARAAWVRESTGSSSTGGAFRSFRRASAWSTAALCGCTTRCQRTWHAGSTACARWA